MIDCGLFFVSLHLSSLFLRPISTYSMRHGRYLYFEESLGPEYLSHQQLHLIHFLFDKVPSNDVEQHYTVMLSPYL